MPTTYDMAKLAPPQNVPNPVKLAMKEGSRTYLPTPESAKLLEEIGGVDTLTKITTAFYTRVFKNQHLMQFFEKTCVELHAGRLANWVAEKMGGDAAPQAASAGKPRQLKQNEGLGVTSQPELLEEDRCVDGASCEVVLEK